MKMSYLYLLQLIDILSLLDVQLEDVDDSPVDIQHSCRDAIRCKHSANHTTGILKLHRCRELSSQGLGELGGWNKSIFGPDATVLKDFRVHKL